MQITLPLYGTISTSPSKGKYIDYENVLVNWVIDFAINADGFIKATPINIPSITVYDYDDVNDLEIPKEMSLYVKPQNIKIKGQSTNLTLIPKTFRYNQEDETLILEYF